MDSLYFSDSDDSNNSNDNSSKKGISSSEEKNEIQESSKQRSKRLKNEKRARENEENEKERLTELLETRQKELFNEVCSSENTEFINKLENKDKDYIEELGNKIEVYTDALALQFDMKDICSSDELFQKKKIQSPHVTFKNQLKTKHCFNTKIKDESNELIFKDACPPLPGYVYFEEAKTFIPQLYHILSDYNFFYIYLKFPAMVDEGQEMPRYEYLKSKWSLRLGRIIERLDGKENRMEFIKMLLCRIRRVKFLRSFSTFVCSGGEHKKGSDKRWSYDEINSLYTLVYKVLVEELDEISQS